MEKNYKTYYCFAAFSALGQGELGKAGWAKLKKTGVLSLLFLFLSVAQLNAQTYSIVGSGTASNGSSAYPCPLGNYYYGNRTQMFVTAAQLTAAGISSGNYINSLGFNVSALNGVATLNSYTIKVYTTTAANPISSGWVTSGQVATGNVGNVTVTTGWNQLNLDGGFTWDGTSNLVIETCFNNTAWTSNPGVVWTTTGLGTGTWSRWYRADISGVCSSTATTNTSASTRPNIRFGWLAAAPSCVQPTFPTIVSTGGTTGNISWTASASSPTGYEYAVTTSATAPASGTATTDTSVTGVTLTPNTTNYLHVRTNCSGTYSAWASSSLYIGYCIPAPTSQDGSGITNFTLGAINNTTGSESGYYGNYTSLSASAGQGTTQPFSITYSTGFTYGTKIWVDWNNDYDFTDSGELVYTGLSAANNPTTLTGSFVVPSGASLGAHRMRVGGTDNDSGPDTPCYASYYGTFEDYTLNVTAPPACFTPTNLTAVPATYTSATVSWTASPTSTAGGYIYYYSTTNDISTAAAGTTSSTSVTLTGLSFGTTYYVWVKTDCGVDGLSEVVTTSFYQGYCVPSYTYTGYNILSFSTTNGLSTNISNTTAQTAAYSNNVSSMAGVDQFAGSSFNYSLTVPGYTDAEIWIDWNQDMDFADAGEQMSSQTGYGSGNTTYTGTVTVPSGTANGTYIMRVRSRYYYYASSPCDNYYYGVAQDYRITISDPPACAPVTGFTASAVSLTSAVLSWTASSSSVATYIYAYSTTNDVTTATTGTTSDTGVTISGLTTGATYYFWVRTACTSGISSSWVTSSPVLLNYCTPSSSYTGYNINSFVTASGYTNINNTTAQNTGYASLTTQFVSQSAGGAFTYTLNVPGYTDAEIWVDWNGDLDFSDSGEQVASHTVYGASTTNFTGTITVPTGTANGSYVMRVRSRYYYYAASPCGNYYYGAAQDYTITVADPPTCPSVTGLSIVPTSLTTATVSWNATTPAPLQYEYAVTTSSTAPSSGTLFTTATSVTDVAVTSNTVNYLHVRAVCDGSVGFWITTSLYVGYCIPSSVYGCTDQDVIARVILNTLDNQTGSSCPGGTTGYSDYSSNPSLTTTLQAGGTYNCTIYSDYWSEGYAVWIDYDDDGVFDNATERIGYSAGTIGNYSSATFPISLSCTPPVGTHRMRVRAMYSTNGVDVTPCTGNSYGEVEDYTITITAPDPCPAPHNLAVSSTSISTTGATLTWTQGCEETVWEAAIVANGAGTPIGAGTSTTAMSYSATGLSASTTYQFYVRSVCEAGVSYSTWAGPFTFTTSPINDVCSGAISLESQVSPLTASTTNASHDFSPSCDVSTSPDLFYSISVPQGYTVNITQTSNDFDSVVSVFYGSCASQTSITCFDDPDDIAVSWTNTTGSTQTVYWVEDGYNGGSGSFTLVWSLTVPTCFTWTGATSTSWTTGSNWCGSVVPTSADDVVIADTANDPVIASGVAYAHNLTLGAGATLTVSTGATLSVDNILSVNPTATLTVL
ncbi:GEVED domain-containing protein, partial [Flavobacterium sp. RHBU_3]|uniref:GEVED domain-containing protein n=1 Tax=Flavobacterium sp. RHBU_3 TaxID=3391184 RepID=UPI0039853932